MPPKSGHKRAERSDEKGAASAAASNKKKRAEEQQEQNSSSSSASSSESESSDPDRPVRAFSRDSLSTKQLDCCDRAGMLLQIAT